MYQFERRRLHQVTALIFTLLGVGCFSYLSMMLHTYPLFDWAIDDLAWTREWLYMTCLDYEGAALCLACIAFFSEQNVFVGVLWGLGFCLLGSPVCCAYIVYRLLFRGIALSEDVRRNGNSSEGVALTESEPLKFYI